MLGELPLSQTSGALTSLIILIYYILLPFSVLTHIEFVLAHRDEEPEFVEWGYGGMGSVNNSSQGAGELIRLLVFFGFLVFRLCLFQVYFARLVFPPFSYPSPISSCPENVKQTLPFPFHPSTPSTPPTLF